MLLSQRITKKGVIISDPLIKKNYFTKSDFRNVYSDTKKCPTVIDVIPCARFQSNGTKTICFQSDAAHTKRLDMFGKLKVNAFCYNPIAVLVYTIKAARRFPFASEYVGLFFLSAMSLTLNTWIQFSPRVSYNISFLLKALILTRYN